MPPRASPTAVLTMSCSAMPISKKRSGKACAKPAVRVERNRSASTTATREFSLPNASKASP